MINTIKETIVARSLEMVTIWKSILEEDETVQKYTVKGDNDWGNEMYNIEVTFKR